MTTDTVELLQGIQVAILDGNEIAARQLGQGVLIFGALLWICLWTLRGRV